MEDWINKVLSQDIEQNPEKPIPTKFNSAIMKPAQTLSIDMNTMSSLGIPIEQCRRLQKSLFVHTVGFYDLVTEITKGCKDKSRV